MKDVNPKETSRASAFETWMSSPSFSILWSCRENTEEAGSERLYQYLFNFIMYKWTEIMPLCFLQYLQKETDSLSIDGVVISFK